jgi:hypothetical protein
MDSAKSRGPEGTSSGRTSGSADPIGTALAIKAMETSMRAMKSQFDPSDVLLDQLG